MNKKMLVMAGMMLVSGASVSLYAKYTTDDVITAAQKGKMHNLRRALRGGVDVDSRDRYGYTALHYAAQRNNEQLARYLVSKGASINATTRDGQTARDLAPVGTHTYRYLQGAGGMHSAAAPEIQERTRQPYSQAKAPARKSSAARPGESWEDYEARMKRQYRNIPRGAMQQKRMKHFPRPETRPEGFVDDAGVSERRMIRYTGQ